MCKGRPGDVIPGRRAPERNATPLIPVGPTDGEGSCSPAVAEVGSGPLAGRSVALVRWRTRAEGAVETEPAPEKWRRYVAPDRPELIRDRLGGRYMNTEKSHFRSEINPVDQDREIVNVST